MLITNYCLYEAESDWRSKVASLTGTDMTLFRWCCGDVLSMGRVSLYVYLSCIHVISSSFIIIIF